MNEDWSHRRSPSDPDRIEESLESIRDLYYSVYKNNISLEIKFIPLVVKSGSYGGIVYHWNYKDCAGTLI